MSIYMLRAPLPACEFCRCFGKTQPQLNQDRCRDPGHEQHPGGRKGEAP